MDEQLVEALEDRTVDNRGDRPVFISSTNLFGKEKIHFTYSIALGRTRIHGDCRTHSFVVFSYKVYIKGSITRCTVLSNGKAFFLLYQAFQDSLRKYSQILVRLTLKTPYDA
jgi:vacuolar protein sorting-associated protein 53